VTQQQVTSESFGRAVLGPIFAEFCLRLWSIGALLTEPDRAAMLFCARGGLRMHLAYEAFLRSSCLPGSVRTAPLMVSRLAAVRSAIWRTIEDHLDTLVPSAAATLSYELPRASVSEVAHAMSGVAPPAGRRWEDRFTPRGFAELLHHREGASVVEAVAGQANLFARHVRGTLEGRSRAVLVDTGLFGTTGQLLADGFPDLDVSSVLIARANYRREAVPRHAKVFGVSVQSDGYSPIQRRTAILRYWHFMESLFEPALESVRTFAEHDGVPRSNLEVENWQSRVRPARGTAFAGLLDYIEALPPWPAEQITRDADRAWTQFHRAIVWPNRSHGFALRAGLRSYDFGSDVRFSERSGRGSLAALRGSSMWREGEIARSGSPLRLPLLAAIEAAHSARTLLLAARRRWGSD
jgi:hypothetical protein